MAENKELWRGAGLWLDFRNISDEDRDKVERRLSEIGELKAQIVFLKRLLETYKYALIAIFEDLKKVKDKRHHEWAVIKGRSTESAAAHAREPVGEFTRRGKRFELYVIEKIKHLSAMLKIESEAAPPAASSAGDKTIASRELGKVKALTAAQRVWVFHFLLQAAGMKEDELQKTEIARFIVAATGSEPGKVYDHVRAPDRKSEKEMQKDLSAIKSWFQKLGMTDIVKKIEQEQKLLRS
jgi:hypothetical protein